MKLFFKRRGPGPSRDDAEIETLVSSALDPLRHAKPETEGRWTRLERAITQPAESPAEARRTAPGLQAAGRPVPRAGSRGAGRPARIRFVFAALSAAAVVVALIVWFSLPSGRQLPGRFTTGRGEQLRITLPDSSEVVLNHTSSLDFNPREFALARSVAITGEAYFSIRKNGAPFVVSTDAGSVTVTGTRFNVRVRGDHYQVGVTEGSVRALLPLPGADTTVLLTAGNLLQGVRNAPPGPVRPIGYAGYPGWPDRKFIFTSMDVRSVCDELTSTFDVEISVADPVLASTNISGVFEAKDVRTVLSTLCALTGRNYRYENGKYILY